MSQYALTVACSSNRGIVAAIANYLSNQGCNITDSSQFDDVQTGKFFMGVSFQWEAGKTLADLESGFAETAAKFGLQSNFHDEAEKIKVVIMVSRFGHCLNDPMYRVKIGALPVDIVAVISNHMDYQKVVVNQDIPCHRIKVTKENKPTAEAAIMKVVEDAGAELIVLARYMQILSNEMCQKMSGRIINIHHSFLPSFKGANPYKQAYERGVKLIGATSHYVTADLDEGPIIEQDTTRVTHAQSAEDYASLGRDVEAQVLARAIHAHIHRRVFLNGNKTGVFPASPGFYGSERMGSGNSRSGVYTKPPLSPPCETGCALAMLGSMVAVRASSSCGAAHLKVGIFMTKAKQSGTFAGNRFPSEISAYAVWANHRFPMGLRDVEDLLAARGIVVSCVIIRAWVAKFGLQHAKLIRRDRPQVAEKWHLDGVVLPIKGKKYWLWRAVDNNGDILDILIQSRRNKLAAGRFFRKPFKALGAPRVIVTDKFRSYGAGLKALLRASSIAAIKVSTIDPRSHIARPGGEKNVWGGSNHPGKHSGFCPPMIRSKTSFARAATLFQPLATVNPEPTPIGSGAKSSASSKLLDIRYPKYHREDCR